MKERSVLVERALAMLHAAPSRQTVAPSMPTSGWLSRWRELAQVTSGLEPDDPRLSSALDALAVCEAHYKAGNLDHFMKSAGEVQRLLLFVPGATVRWHGSHGHQLTVLGPAVVEHVHHDHGRLWVWVEWDGTGRWVSEAIITTIEGPTS